MTTKNWNELKKRNIKAYLKIKEKWLCNEKHRYHCSECPMALSDADLYTNKCGQIYGGKGNLVH